MTDEELEALGQKPHIIRNRLKIYAARRNALIFLTIQKEHGTFWQYLEMKISGI